MDLFEELNLEKNCSVELSALDVLKFIVQNNLLELYSNVVTSYKLLFTVG